jgi:hypothetical protein
LETLPLRPIAFGLYLPYAHSAVWVAAQAWEQTAALGVPNHGRTLRKFQQLCLADHLDFDLPNLELAADRLLQTYSTLVIASGRWMDERTQQKLRGYVAAGGRLILVGEIPTLNADYQPTHLLADVQAKIQVIRPSDFYAWTLENWDACLAVSPEIVPLNQEASQALIWHYVHPQQDIDYLFVFSGKDTIRPVEFQFNARGQTHTLGLTLPPSSAGVLRIQHGSLTELLVKGKNEEARKEVLVVCRLDGVELSADQPGDWAYPG